ncbi:cytochrome-c peroxidase [Saccharospirillum salsuginis]|uniref:Methylamine utilization protein n=1 Tax=Saccharospirillum salsuginis TaxID=418750 RepID=A0A918NC78_9GAMM|nr:cytochrome c peroxidase [Saccharospirillum salsuginis]GGX57064.1 methylamine utilization protein [Saccharospirillum salsuginis]
MIRPAVLFLLLAFTLPTTQAEQNPYTFTEADIQFLSMFTLDNLPDLPDAPSNRLADNDQAARLGHQLFFDTGLSANGEVACSTCHQPERYFTDGLPQSQALGTTRRNAPSIPSALHGPWQFWDGRTDSLWAQALSPLEDLNEHGMDRTSAARYFVTEYRDEYEALFGASDEAERVRALTESASPKQPGEPAQAWSDLDEADRDAVNRVFAQLGKVIMAYERKLDLEPARFDRFVNALQEDKEESRLRNLLTDDEVNGMRLFMGKANCASCHNGPLFTNFEFHNIGAPEADRKNVDLGRFEGVAELQDNTFTCLSDYSDADPEQCEEMRFLKQQGPELVGAFKTPSLRNVNETAPYMQAGQLATLMDVIAHYNTPTPPFYDREQHPSRPHFDILPLKLTVEEQEQLAAFLATLTSPIPDQDKWWQAPTR